MALMHMVEMTSHEVVRMVAVGNSFMAAARAVPVGGFVTAARVSSTAFRRIIRPHGRHAHSACGHREGSIDAQLPIIRH